MGEQRAVFPLTFSSGLFVEEHRKRMGSAIWVFGCLIDRVTSERREGDQWIGSVMGGAPIKAEEIVDQLGIDERTTRKHLDDLESAGYIRRTRTPRGYAVEILNSKKREFWKARRGQNDRAETSDHEGSDRAISSGQNESDRAFCSERPGETTRSNKTYHDLSNTPADAGGQVAGATAPGVSDPKKKPSRKSRTPKAPVDPRTDPNGFINRIAETCPDVSLAARARLCGQVKPILKDLLRATDDPQARLWEMWEGFRAGKVDGQWPMNTGKPHDVETFCMGTIQSQLLQGVNSNGKARATVPCPKCGSPATVQDGIASCPKGCQKWRVQT